MTMSKERQRIIVKIGSNVLSEKNGRPDIDRMTHIVDQIAQLRIKGYQVILVSSGAVAFGRNSIHIDEQQNTVATRQLLASVGQIALMSTYSKLFERHGLQCAQVLVTKEDFRDRTHYLNMRNCLDILLYQRVVPVMNENDVIAVTELMFTDNDELAGLIATMLDANELIVLTNVDGIYDGNPKDEASKVIKVINLRSNVSDFISAEKSAFGRGGMLTKSATAKKTAKLGVQVHIANGKKDNILIDVLNEESIHSRFLPGRQTSSKKKWLAHSENAAKGSVKINEGARMNLLGSKANSLLPIGIIKVINDFEKGDVIKILDEFDNPIGLGMAKYSAEQTSERLGKQKQPALIHYDHLYLF